MKNIFRKILCVLLLLSLGVLSGCDNLAGYTSNQALSGIQEVTLSSSKLNMNINTTVNCSFDQYFSSSFDPTVVNEDLRKWCFVSLMDAHDIGYADLKARPNTASSVASKEQSFWFLYQLGFGNYAQLIVGADATTDIDDTVTILYSTKDLTRVNGKGRHVINVSLCGAASAADWSSNFDIGSTVEEYGNNHPDWKVTDNHKGYDVAATRVIEFLKEELKYTKNNNDQYFICLSGYSRGAAVANIVSQRLIDDPTCVREKGFILANYNFACPRTTTSTSCHDAKYNSIHNYINDDDIVTYLPANTEQMNFQRYGVDHVFSIQNNESLKTRQEAIANNPYDASCAPTVIQAVRNMTPTRDGLYKVIEDEAHKTWKHDTIANRTEELAMADYQAFIDEMNDIGIGKYFKFAGLTVGYFDDMVDDPEEGLTVVYDVPYYIWHCYVGDGIVLRVFNTAITNAFCGHPEKATADRSLLKYTNYGSYFDSIVNAIFNHPDFYSDAHFPASYFVGSFEK